MTYRPVENIIIVREQKKDRFLRLQAVPVSGGCSSKLSTVKTSKSGTEDKKGLSDYD